jgi:hypothetical protein
MAREKSEDRWLKLGVLPEMGAWDVRVRVARVDGMIQVVGIRLEPPRDQEPTSRHVISSKSLPALKHRAIARAREMVVGKKPKPPQLDWWDNDDDAWDLASPGPGRGYSDDFYEVVALLYHMAVQEGEKPVPQIQQYMGIEKIDTVNKWIAKARKKGMLTPGRPGVAEGEWIPPDRRNPATPESGGDQ